MVSVSKKKVEAHLDLNGIEKEIKKRKIDATVMKRLIFIKSMFEHDDVLLASKVVGVSLSTGYLWLRRWNAEGLKGLIPKFTGGPRPQLSEEDYEKLDKILKNTPNLTTDLAHEIIEVNFKVDFSERHIQRILRKLKYTYTKPFMVYAKMPDDAEVQLQKKLSK
jgi:putative transposase